MTRSNKRQSISITITMALLPIFLVSCAASISPEAKEELGKPINCETAAADIEALKAERASVAEQLSAGVRSVVPAAAVAGILRHDTKDRATVATGRYNQSIEEKIFEIRQNCTLIPGPEGGIGTTRGEAEGLRPVSKPNVGFAAVRPGVDFSSYKRLRVAPVHLEFKKTRDSYDHNPRRVERIKRYFFESVEKELEEKGGYPIVRDPAPDALDLYVALVDIVVLAPPDERGSEKTWVSETGEVTMVMELRDSQSQQVVARAADRRRIGSGGAGGGYRNTPTRTASEIRTLFTFWSRLLRERLDSAEELSRMQE